MKASLLQQSENEKVCSLKENICYKWARRQASTEGANRYPGEEWDRK